MKVGTRWAVTLGPAEPFDLCRKFRGADPSGSLLFPERQRRRHERRLATLATRAIAERRIAEAPLFPRGGLAEFQHRPDLGGVDQVEPELALPVAAIHPV